MYHQTIFHFSQVSVLHCRMLVQALQQNQKHNFLFSRPRAGANITQQCTELIGYTKQSNRINSTCTASLTAHVFQLPKLSLKSIYFSLVKKKNSWKTVWYIQNFITWLIYWMCGMVLTYLLLYLLDPTGEVKLIFFSTLFGKMSVVWV